MNAEDKSKKHVNLSSVAAETPALASAEPASEAALCAVSQPFRREHLPNVKRKMGQCRWTHAENDTAELFEGPAEHALRSNFDFCIICAIWILLWTKITLLPSFKSTIFVTIPLMIYVNKPCSDWLLTFTRAATFLWTEWLGFIWCTSKYEPVFVTSQNQKAASLPYMDCTYMNCLSRVSYKSINHSLFIRHQ